MMIYKLIALAFVILTPIFSQIIISLFKLKKHGILFTDLSFPLFALEIFLVSSKFLTHSLIPYYLIALSLLAILLTIHLIRRTENFSYKRFFKFFWRIGFFLTLAFYLVLLVIIFII